MWEGRINDHVLPVAVVVCKWLYRLMKEAAVVGGHALYRPMMDVLDVVCLVSMREKT